MYKMGEVIAHNKLGLCTIKEITQINDIDYYVLISNIDNTKIMIPISNADKLTRKIITKEEIEELVNKIPNINIDLIKDFKTRMKTYDELLKSGEIENLAILSRTIYEYKKESKNLTVADKEIFKATEKILFDELAYVLNIDNKNDVSKYLFKKVH